MSGSDSEMVQIKGPEEPRASMRHFEQNVEKVRHQVAAADVENAPHLVAVATRNSSDSEAFSWTARNVLVSILLFFAAAVAEIGGGWLVWQTMREGKPWYMAVIGSLVLVLYGFIPTLQPIDNFGRLYAVYGGFFILFSYLWGWLLDGNRPDAGDWIGTGVALVGVLIALLWPR